MSNHMYTEEFKTESVKQISERDSPDPIPKARRESAVVSAVTASAVRLPSLQDIEVAVQEWSRPA